MRSTALTLLVRARSSGRWESLPVLVGVEMIVGEAAGERSRVALLGREAELGVLGGLLDTIATRSMSIVVHGDAGQGKSSLLDWVSDTAHGRGMAVLRATGVEFECELAFSGPMAVLRPLLTRVGSLAETQRRTLDVAMGLVGRRSSAPTGRSRKRSAVDIAACQTPGPSLVKATSDPPSVTDVW